ncbi:hypothetical protein BKA82DRAFT_34562 [Pisolithus tinctorius]|uniref:Uncharacterized protein n=1 Tax=Pisolithus tinctorius Marx 270 TaxID=870435 RepID=A0A0C3JBE2_PISTI|nr:hypothetical protein BKA82DRAFT_34562 [Pisolithus tinctorius]KIN94996.1 hypothetical protein M404DRAFT_34562 [Pisolithus tinctorius Marx 270]
MSLNTKIQGIFHNIIASQNCQLSTSLVMASDTLPLDARTEALATFSLKKQANYRTLMKGHPPVDPTAVKGSRKVFDYFDKNPSQKGNRSALLSVTPDWQLLTINHCSFLIVKVAQPNGSTLYENKGCGKACIVVWTIPDDIYELWNTEPLVLGSNSEVDSDASGDSFHGTEIICLSNHNHNGSGSNIDVKLSSSMIELDLHCGDDHIIAKVMDKGKGIEKHHLILKMPP